MGVWVRSQNKKILTECSRLVVSNNCEIIESTGNGRYYEMGNFESEDEAVAVLEEIHRDIERMDWNYGYTYQMPPKGFLKEKAAGQNSEVKGGL